MSQEALYNFLMSLTVALPAAVGIIRFGRMETSYYPFLIYIFVSLFNELLVGLVLIYQTNAIKTLDWQLFNLFESIILFWQFHQWKVFERYKKLFVLLFCLMITGWLTENFIFSTIFGFNPVYLISYSFILVLLSVQTINHIIVNQNRVPLYKNAMFIICVGMVLYFIYTIFVFTLLAKGISKTNKQLMTQVFDIKVYINALINILYGLAVLYIPQKISSSQFFNDRKNL